MTYMVSISSLRTAALTGLTGLSALLAAEPLPLHVSGTKVLNSKGQQVLLRGVNCASLEWSSDGEGHILKSVDVAIKDWHANIVRIPLAQGRWFGVAPEQKGDYAPYRNLVDQVVRQCAESNVYVMLDLHWNDMGSWSGPIGQHLMPDKNSLTFWRSIARVFRNNPAVLFDLYNEPHDVTWEIWRNGGSVTEQTGYGAKATRTTYDAVGMQTLLDAVRTVGANNLVVAGGLDWAYDMTGFHTGYLLNDPTGNGVIYANHYYPMKADTVKSWTAKMEKAAQTYPFIVSEFGANNWGSTKDQPNVWVKGVVDALKSHKWHYTAWDLHVSAGPTLISNWDYLPTPSFGSLVRADLAKKP